MVSQALSVQRKMQDDRCCRKIRGDSNVSLLQRIDRSGKINFLIVAEIVRYPLRRRVLTGFFQEKIDGVWFFGVN